MVEASQDTASRVSILVGGFEDGWTPFVATERQDNSRSNQPVANGKDRSCWAVEGLNLNVCAACCGVCHQAVLRHCGSGGS